MTSLIISNLSFYSKDEPTITNKKHILYRASLLYKDIKNKQNEGNACVHPPICGGNLLKKRRIYKETNNDRNDDDEFKHVVNTQIIPQATLLRDAGIKIRKSK